MVLNTLLQTPRLHPQLLELLQKWPIELYSLKSVTDNAVNKLRSMRGDSPEGAKPLMETLAYLYKLQGRHDLALAIYLRLKLPTVFDFIKRYHLYYVLSDQVPELFAIDHNAAIDLFVGQLDVIPPSSVVPMLQERQEQFEADQDNDEKVEEQQQQEDQQDDKHVENPWRRYIHMYLSRVFEIDKTAAAEFHDLQVDLYADYEPENLMEFLKSSQYYRLEQAHATCMKRGFTEEMVYLLGRMGNLRQAVCLIVDDMNDVPKAIQFIQGHGDEDLWDLLIELGMKDEKKLGTLLDTVGAHINPEKVIQKIPEGMVVQKLRDRLVYIIRDYKLQMQLTRGSSTIIRSDCIQLSGRLYNEIRAAVQAEFQEKSEVDEVQFQKQPLLNRQSGISFLETSSNVEDSEYIPQLTVRQFKPPKIPGYSYQIAEVPSLVI
eukprot:TRINITY_DN7654_c0_g1_i1.p2 TRINITY_DN7654_c0_g1~~TRINITY_DN7654_c0_g1_i1.p2  ORF type:complete len:432 (-),score=50.12 TRINITY_DN7654_c0_g1_i1:261-1556(-)